MAKEKMIGINQNPIQTKINKTRNKISNMFGFDEGVDDTLDAGFAQVSEEHGGKAVREMVAPDGQGGEGLFERQVGPFQSKMQM